MVLDTFKDLKKGDKVSYKAAFKRKGKPDRGEGEVAGFGKFGYTDIVWVKGGDGRLQSAVYKDVKKL